MFGNKMLSKAIIKVSEEGAKQHEVVKNELDKLCQLTNQGWDLVSSKMFDKARKISFGQGMLAGAGITGLVAAARNKLKKDKPKTDDKE